MRRRYCQLLIALLLLLQTAVLQAQGEEWQERRTLLFSILYPAGAEAIAEQYAQFVDGIYDETSALWGYRPPPPVILRIYPTMELYYEANPIAAKMPGVVAHAHTGRREISVAIPQTAGQSEEELRNNIRHELTHIVAADLSGSRLTTPWQEGIAQYVEHPSEQLERKMELMRQIMAENRLLSWRDLNQPGVTYADPHVGYPESYTIVAFLVQRDGMSRFRQFVEAMKDSSGYRSALEQAYGKPADVLEAEWRAQLPHFVTEGYRAIGNASGRHGSFDLASPEQLMAQGDYSGAIAALRAVIPTMQAAGDRVALSRAQALLARAEVGERAAQFAKDAHGALVRGDYQAARAASASGQKAFTSIGQSDQVAVMAEYEGLATRGLQAQAKLNRAGGLLRRLRLRDAEALLISAYTTFAELGDEPRAAQARATLNVITRGEQMLAAICVASGIGMLAWSGRRRHAERRVALPFT